MNYVGNKRLNLPKDRLATERYLLNNKHKIMRYLKIMGIFTSILSLLSCGHGNKRVTQNDGINPNIPVAAQITIDKLPDVLRNVQAGKTDYDFIGICSNGVDCIYFVLENGKFYAPACFLFRLYHRHDIRDFS